MTIIPVGTRIFIEGESLLPFIREHVPTLQEGSVIAIASKIVALSQRRTAPLSSRSKKEALIVKESDWAIRTPQCWLTIKDNMLIPSAGIDESNANGKLVLLPANPYGAAHALRRSLSREYRIARLGVILTDSMIIPLRAGVLGIAIAYSGFHGVRDYRGKKDIFGRTMRVSMTNVADSLATAATLVMGEGAETQPLAVIADAPVVFSRRPQKAEMSFAPKNDLFKPFFDALRVAAKAK